MDYYKLLGHYADGYDNNIDLIEEAIEVLEQYFSYMDIDELMHHSKQLAIPYLALRQIRYKEITNG